MRNNYVTQVEQAAAAFSRLHYPEISRRFGLKLDAEGLHTVFLQKAFVIAADGSAWAADGSPAPFGIAMTLYDALSRPKKASLSGRWCAHSTFHAVRGGSLQSRLEMSDAGAAAPFARKPAALEQVCAAVGGQRVQSVGDFAYRLPLLPWMPVLLRFWRADEEFPAQLQLLWDANLGEFLHYETSWYAAGALLTLLEERMH